ncbi:MAG TPA: DUF58 domain-containing protein [Bacteroidia bacterium]|jgi:uncharacterized protein (DUF58 family)|nr:DUF58 domain-containing protein [Bacteroidia bacterium]
MQTIDQQPLQQFTHLELIAKQVVEGFITGLHKSPFHGFSVEFAEHRLYNKGESTRHIDWKLYGRTDKLFVKRYEEETNLRCQIILDASSSMYYPVVENKAFSFTEKKGKINKITFSAYCAAALIELLKRQRDAVGLSIFADSVELHTSAKSSSLHQKLLFRELEKRIQPPDLKIHKETAVITALHEISESIHKRSLVIIFSDMMDSRANSDELFSALQHLKHNKHEVIVFHVTDKEKELDFDFENRPYRFIDLETGEEIKLHPNELKENYLAQMAAYKKELMLKCGQNKIQFIEADINLGFDQVLLPYLIKRTKMM